MIILVEEGALPEQVDKVMVDFGYPIGPFATADLSGLDIGYDSRQRRAAQNPNYRKLPIADHLVEIGRLGQKSGAGWFRYEKGDRTPHPDPEVARIIKDKAAELGIAQRNFSDEETCAGCYSPRSTRPARSSKRARPTGPATST